MSRNLPRGKCQQGRRAEMLTRKMSQPDRTKSGRREAVSSAHLLCAGAHSRNLICSHSHHSLRGGYGCPHPTGEEQELPRGLESAFQGHTPRREQSASSSPRYPKSHEVHQPLASLNPSFSKTPQVTTSQGSPTSC